MNFESIADSIINKTISSGATGCDVVLAKGSGKSISCRLQKIEDIEDYNDNQIDLNIFENEFKKDNYGTCGTISDINKKPPNGHFSIILGFAIILLFSRFAFICMYSFSARDRA